MVEGVSCREHTYFVTVWCLTRIAHITYTVYRGGGFIWYPTNRKRQEFVRKIQREGLHIAGFEEPGQDGFAENPIPKLDSEPGAEAEADDE